MQSTTMPERRAACSSPPLPQVTRAALWLGSAWLLAGCTAPRFAPEQSTDRSPADAGTAGAAQVEEDPRWAPWIGRYAARSILYATDGLLRPTSEEISLVVIEPRGDRLVLEQQLCLFEGGWSFVGLEGNLRYRYLDDVSFVTELVVRGKNFETEPALFRLGFESAVPRACAEARSAASDRPWLSGECACPGATSMLPAKSNDCRVTDPDQDEQPGVTFNAALSGTRLSYYAAQEVVVRYSNGYRIDDSLYANVESFASTTVFGCDMPELAAGCMVGTARPCPTEFNKTVFVPLADDDYDCSRVVRERAGLFPTPIPPFPGACAAGI
jgi:hypothetical protein